MKKAIKIRKLKRGSKILLFSSFFLAIAIIAGVIFINYGKMKTLDSSAYTFFFDKKIEIGSDSTIVEKKNGTYLKNKVETLLLTTPIYIENDTAIFLPYDYVYYNPRDIYLAKASKFSKISKAETGYKYASKKSVDIPNGFLYDGENTYVFLEDVKLKYANYTLDIPAMSTIIVETNNEMIIYNINSKELKQYDIYGFDIEIIVDDYYVNCATDVLVDSKDNKQLIFSNPEILDEIKEVRN